MGKVFTYILFIFNLIATIALIISYLSGYISPDKWWVPSFFGLIYPVLLIINLAFMVIWLFFEPIFSLLPLIVIIAGYGYLTRFIQLKGKATEEKGIKVLSYNVKHFAGQGEGNDRATARLITQFIKNKKPDIICLQEVRLRDNSIFNLSQTVKELENIKHYQYARSGATLGAVTMTRYPIVDMGEIRFKGSGNITIYTDILIEKDTMRVFNLHLQSYKVDPGAYSLTYLWTDETGMFKKLRELASRFKRAFVLRARQVKEIREYIDECPYDILLCGDFNDTPASYSYVQLSRGLKDAFVSSGKGIMSTYIGGLPSLRIDYILHSKSYKSYNFETSDYKYSDHLPVLCTLIKK